MVIQSGGVRMHVCVGVRAGVRVGVRVCLCVPVCAVCVCVCLCACMYVCALCFRYRCGVRVLSKTSNQTNNSALTREANTCTNNHCVVHFFFLHYFPPSSKIISLDKSNVVFGRTVGTFASLMHSMRRPIVETLLVHLPKTMVSSHHGPRRLPPLC